MSLEFPVSQGFLRKNAESALANRHCIAALAWVEYMKRHYVHVTIVNVTNLEIVSAVYMVGPPLNCSPLSITGITISRR